MTTARYDAFAPLDLTASTRVFILTGAGISAESGIATFRDVNGLWEKFRVEDVASPEGWARDAEVVWRFYSQRRAQAETCVPNAAHRARAELEKAIGNRLFLCTQNVDPLHERAGSSRIVHMHGELFKSRCEDPRCATPPFEDHATYLGEIPKCPTCGKRIRPHICWFGEMPFKMQRIERELDVADIFVTIGSSGAVYPAAGFVRQVRQRVLHGERVRTIYVGPEEPDNADEFDECRLGKAGEAVPGLFKVP
jgi:NAD-dependent deacetylase